MDALKWGDTVKIDHPNIVGTGTITKFYNDKNDSVEVKLIQGSRPSDGKVAIANKKFNCLPEYLSTVSRRQTRSTATIEDGGIMAEVWAYQDREEERIPCFEG